MDKSPRTKCINNKCPKKEYCKTYLKRQYLYRAVYQFVDYKGLVICDYWEFQRGTEDEINIIFNKSRKENDMENS